MITRSLFVIFSVQGWFAIAVLDDFNMIICVYTFHSDKENCDDWCQAVNGAKVSTVIPNQAVSYFCMKLVKCTGKLTVVFD